MMAVKKKTCYQMPHLTSQMQQVRRKISEPIKMKAFPKESDLKSAYQCLSPSSFGQLLCNNTIKNLWRILHLMTTEIIC